MEIFNYFGLEGNNMKEYQLSSPVQIETTILDILQKQKDQIKLLENENKTFRSELNSLRNHFELRIDKLCEQ